MGDAIWLFIVHNSYGISAAIVAVWAASNAVRRRTVRSLALFGIVAVALIVPPLWLRSSQSNLGDLDHALASGRPTMLELYSDL